MPRLRCPHCGHDVSGVATRRCPECGELFDRAWLQHEASQPVAQLWQMAVLILAVPIGLSAWLIFTIWALGWMAASAMLPAAAGIVGVVCLINSAAAAARLAAQLQRRSVAADLPPRTLTLVIGFASFALQLTIVAAAIALGRWLSS